jgi:vacuolar-type H+-ATPase subunit I/STV1
MGKFILEITDKRRESLKIVFGDDTEIVKRETGEVGWDTYSEYFEEVLEGRSIKSVVKALRKAGYSVSETTVRARFREWQAYRRAKEELEIEINYLKGELLEKIRETQKEIEEEIQQRSLKTKKVVEDLTLILEKKFKEIEFLINDKIDSIRKEHLNHYSELRRENSLLKKAVIQILEGIADKGITESLKDAISKKLTDDVINYLRS